MQEFYVVCYTLSVVCFLISTFKNHLAPITLDLIAFGLFFFALPTLVQSFSKLL